MNQPFLYDPQTNILRQRAEMKKPAIQGKFPGVVPEWDKYIEHIKSLPAYTPVSGWVPEVGRTFELDKDFFVRECSCKRDPENIIFHIICEKTNTGQDELCAVAVPIEQKQECKHEPMVDTGVGYYHCPACDWSCTYQEYEAGHTSKKERSFTLADMIECWEAGKSYGIADERSQAWSNVREPDKKQYFKTKFNISIDDQGK